MPTENLPRDSNRSEEDQLHFTVLFPKGVSREVIENLVRVHVGQFYDLSVRIDSAASSEKEKN